MLHNLSSGLINKSIVLGASHAKRIHANNPHSTHGPLTIWDVHAPVHFTLYDPARRARCHAAIELHFFHERKMLPSIRNLGKPWNPKP